MAKSIDVSDLNIYYGDFIAVQDVNNTGIESGLDKPVSDYVASLTYSPNRTYTFATRARVDQATGDINRFEAEGKANFDRWSLGVLYGEQRQFNDAIAAFEYGIRVAPDADTLYLNLGRIHIQMGDRQKARRGGFLTGVQQPYFLPLAALDALAAGFARLRSINVARCCRYSLSRRSFGRSGM